MIKRYIFSDPIFRENTLSQSIRVDDSLSILNIFRMTSGTIDCIDGFKNSKHKLRKNYLDLPYKNNETLSRKIIEDCFPEEVDLNDINNYFKKARNNIKFYKSIETEYIKCLIAEKEKRYLESFFYLYRIIEGICYSVPLIYVSKNKDYNKSYSDLQSYFGKDKDGELAFFKRFVAETFKKEDFYKSNIIIDLLDIDIEEVRSLYYGIYLKNINTKSVIDKEEGEFIKIKFIGLYELIIELRNRFFHNAKGTWQENLESTDLIYPDLFFKPIINHGINWISLILFEIIKTDFSKIN